MDTAKGKKWIKNTTSASLRNKIKDKTNASDNLKSGPPSKNQNILLKSEKSINKIAIKNEVRTGKPQPKKVAKSMPKKQSIIKRIKSTKKASKLSLRDKKHKAL